MPITINDVLKAIEAGGVETERADAIVRYLQDQEAKKKDTMPAAGRPDGGYAYNNGPWTLIPGDIHSMVIYGGSNLSRWIPTSRTTTLTEHVKHLEFVTPKGFDGSQTYSDWLAGISLDDCGYGPSTQWNGFEYRSEGGTWSFATDMMKVFPDGGMAYYEQQPRYTVRGDSENRIQMSTDAEWAIARILLVLEQHTNWVQVFGDRRNSRMEIDGLTNMITETYVFDNLVGRGQPHWARPFVINGASITTAQGLLQEIRKAVRMQRRRLNATRGMVRFEDVAIYMPEVMFNNVAEAEAQGVVHTFATGNNLTYQMDYQDFANRYNRILETRQLMVDGRPIQVLTDDHIGMEVYDNGTSSTLISGPVLGLVRTINGDNVLEQKYYDYSQLEYPTSTPEDMLNLQGGIVRTGWVTESNKCYYWYAEMGGRQVIRSIPHFFAINNVAIPTLFTGENEAGSFTSPDYYALGATQRGGRGTGYINPLN